MVREFALGAGLSFLLSISPAWAVPGFAYDFNVHTISVSACTEKARQVVQSVVGAPPGNPTEGLGRWASVTSGFVSDTGVLVECIAHDVDPFCGERSTTFFVFAFSDAGSGRAAAIRDKIIAGYGDAHSLIGC